MRTRTIATSAAVVATVALVALLAAGPARGAFRQAASPARNGHVQTFWPGGVLKSDATYVRDAYEGDYRSYYQSGARYELRHYVNGREQGVQQSWSEDGTPYLNYEVRNGRRFGLVNATPCNIVGDVNAPVAQRRARPLTGAAVRPAAVAASALPFYADASFTPHWTAVPHRVAPFSLTTQTGDRISDATLAGRPYVASFIYTQCAAVCPILVRQLARVQAAVGDVHIVSFSVTPNTDTPAVLAAFGRERGIDPRAWSLVTGDRRTIYELARTSYFADDSRVDAGLDETAFLHTEKLLLVDGAGHLRGIYNGTQPHAVDQLIDDLTALSSAAPSGR